MRRTIINEWTSDWQTSYEEEARQLKRVFQEQLIQIFHIGSTSIPTIGYAKPIIDIVMGVANIDLVALYNEKMATLGYVAHGANGITDRFYYTKGGNNRTHHVHIYHAGHKNINLHLQFKFYMNQHTEKARQYGLVKKELAAIFPYDSSSYQKAKESYVNSLMEKAIQWPIIEKAYGYITRMKNGQPQVLVFQHPVKEAGIQIPKGTVKHGELPIDAVTREMQEETGIIDFTTVKLLIDDYWENDDGIIHHRYFYELKVDEARDAWDFEPTGGGGEDGKVFHCYWIAAEGENSLIRGHADYFQLISK